MPLNNGKPDHSTAKIVRPRRFFIVLFNSYAICFLTYFPGVGMNDSLNIIRRGTAAAKQFPVLYCLFIEVLTRIGNFFGTLQLTVILYTTIQILLCAGISSYIIAWIWSQRMNRAIKYILLTYFAFEPLICMYAVSMLRDTVFSLLLALLTVLILQIMESKETPGKGIWILFGICTVGIIALRNNGFYVILFCLFFMVIAAHRYWKHLLLMFAAACAVVALTSGLMKYYHQEQLFQEAVGIPIQQISATVAENGRIDDDQMALISNLMSPEKIRASYNPYTADAIKWSGDFNRDYLQAHRREFLKVWADLFRKNPGIYAKAWLRQTFWFWAPVQEGTDQCCFSIESVSNNTWLPEFLKTSKIHDQPVLTGTVGTVLRHWYSLGKYFFREGVCLWIMLGTILLLALKKWKKKFFVSFAPMIGLWFTLMISTPISYSFRYVLSYLYLLPFWIACVFRKEV